MCRNEHTLQEIVLLEDLSRLPKDILKEICTNLNLPSNGLTDDLTKNIWEKINNQHKLINTIFEQYTNRLFCGKSPSISWFRILRKDNHKDESIKEIIIKSLKYNPFNTINIPELDELTTKLIIISAADTKKDTEYFLRFMYKTKNTQSFYANKITTYPQNKIITVLINEQENILEIRGDAIAVNKISLYMAKELFNGYLSLEKINLAKTFNSDISIIAKNLDGHVTSASSIANGTWDLTSEESNILKEIFNALNAFFSNDIESDTLVSCMENIKSQNEILLSSVNFELLLLTGLKNVGLTSDESDLNVQPLYNTFKPFVIDRVGSILFNVNIDNIAYDYTANIAFNKNSIYFQGCITEEVIQKIRERLIYVQK